MKIYSNSGSRVTLYVEYEPYERYTRSPIKKARVSGPTLLEALKKLVDNMVLDITSEDIEHESMDDKEVIEYIDMRNGDGCDYIIMLKNLETDEILIESEYYEDEENWDDEDDDYVS